MTTNTTNLPSTDGSSSFSSPVQGGLRDGVPIEKGIVLTEDFLVKNQQLFEEYNKYFMLYPDLFLDLIAAENCPIKFYYYQRIMLRGMMRYRYFYGTFTRGN